MGPVFRAYDAERERLVAVKLFKLDLAPERVHQLVAAFEQLIAAQLTHPAMAVPLATGINGVTAYLAQDYVAAESLDLAVREYGAAPAADALRVVAQLAGALDFGAVMNIGHGALHPRDILLSADETRMTGLGVARALESIGVSVPVRRPYTAPERVAGAAWDRRADIFSLAALAHDMLWARRIAGSGSHVVDALTELPGSRLAALKDSFARALADDPKDRFETALDFAETLKDAFPDITLSEPPAKKKPKAVAKERPPLLPLDVPDEVREEVKEEVRAKKEAPPVDFDADVLELKYKSETVLGPTAIDAPLEASVASPVAEPPPISVIEESRSAVWPLVAALAIGLGVGFASGYGVGTRDRSTAAPAAAAAATTPAVPTATAGRETTEVAVPPKPAPPTATPPAPAPATKAPPSAPPVRSPRPTRPAERAAPSASASTQPGRLSVESKPTGARVFLDGKLIGTTPVALPSVTPGTHAIRIERDGYRRWAASIKVLGAEQNRVTASLER